MSELQKYLDVRTTEKVEKHTLSVHATPPSIRSITPQLVLGSYSMFSNPENHRYIMESAKIETPLGIVTFGDIARFYLEYKYGCGYDRKVRYLTEQWQYFRKWNAVPLYAQPTTFNDAYYIDVKSAWYQITCAVGWDVEYYPDMGMPRWLNCGTPPLDLPFPNIKPLRSTLVSLTRPSKITLWRCPVCEAKAKCRPQNGIPHPFAYADVQHRFNPYYNPALWAVVSDVLNGVAQHAMIAKCATYINNDGYICIGIENAVKMFTILRSWGLVASIKSRGAGWVAGVGHYRVGDMVTKTNGKVQETYKIASIPHAEWLRRQFRKYVVYRLKKEPLYKQTFGDYELVSGM